MVNIFRYLFPVSILVMDVLSKWFVLTEEFLKIICSPCMPVYTLFFKERLLWVSDIKRLHSQTNDIVDACYSREPRENLILISLIFYFLVGLILDSLIKLSRKRIIESSKKKGNDV